MTVEGDVSLNIIIREACESDLSILIEYNRALAKETECYTGNDLQTEGLPNDIWRMGTIS